MTLDLKQLYEKLHKEHRNSRGYQYSSTDLGWFSEYLCEGMESILDVGAGLSPYADRVRAQYGMKRAAVADLSEVPRKFHEERNIEFHCAPVQKLPFKEDEFDIVVSFDCLEHLAPEDVPVAVAELCRVAKKRLIVTVGTQSSKAFDIELHLTQQPLTWWAEQFEPFGKVRIDPNPHNDRKVAKHHPLRRKSQPLSDFIVVDLEA